MDEFQSEKWTVKPSSVAIGDDGMDGQLTG